MASVRWNATSNVIVSATSKAIVSVTSNVILNATSNVNAKLSVSANASVSAKESEHESELLMSVRASSTVSVAWSRNVCWQARWNEIVIATGPFAPTCPWSDCVHAFRVVRASWHVCAWRGGGGDDDAFDELRNPTPTPRLNPSPNPSRKRTRSNPTLCQPRWLHWGHSSAPVPRSEQHEPQKTVCRFRRWTDSRSDGRCLPHAPPDQRPRVCHPDVGLAWS
mmetsp:Transcript_52039/g.130687  ORF Transcript_52039/g.130687 Transcript_52039/m.130687 type:complete len:222 (-) Transcript_52039:424-1089(-)